MSGRFRWLSVGLAAIGAAIVFGGCAQNLTHPPVYRGQYYAFDVYPYGYNGYPAFPYYGAPFGYGGPAFAKVGERIVAPSGKDAMTQTTVRTHRRHRHVDR
ncbi:MAG: hypothetical protein ACJ8KU_11320 [Chthoniobacterales bacterium]